MSSSAPPLAEVIEALKTQGASDEFVVALLKQKGWSEKRILQAFTAHYEARMGQPIPDHGGSIEAAKDAFFYLLTFLTLGVWTVELGALFFTVIDLTFPNPALSTFNPSWNIRSLSDNLAGIIVAFPLFFLITRSQIRDARLRPERLESPVRKWLTYLALVIAAGTLIGDMVTFLAYLLRGDLETRFVLKVLTLLLIAGGVFGYYLGALRREEVSEQRNWRYAAFAGALVVFGLIAGFYKIGSPGQQRILTEDKRRLWDLSYLASSLHQDWAASADKDNFAMPRKLEEVRRMSNGDARLTDPVTGAPYEYLPGDKTSYRLCATFASADPEAEYSGWSHPRGHYCFPLDASRPVTVVQRVW
jgi:Domain of unknown function (DUF5671)